MERKSSNILNGDKISQSNVGRMQSTDEVNGTNIKSANSSPKKDQSPEKNGSDSFLYVGHEDIIVDCSFAALIEKMRQLHYNRQVDIEEAINTKCKLLFERDYRVATVMNDITDKYPWKIIVPLSRKDCIEENPMDFNGEKYAELAMNCRIARLRSRIIAPVILFDDKFICRSGTLTVWVSAFYEAVKQSMPVIEGKGITSIFIEAVSNPKRTISTALNSIGELALNTANLITGRTSMMSLISQDSKIAELLKIERICDLMIEYNKHYMDQFNVSSTEKIFEGIYKNIKMEEMPFPGCEFFVLYTKADRKPEGLVFDWSQSDVTRSLELTEGLKLFPDIDIGNGKKWDLVLLTKNYLKIMLSYLVTGTGGMVVHCISGWDRTPLFVSLLRLSLWADGVVHQSLDFEEMAYLTVAYDWFLFGHNLPDRLKKGEEVMHFAFNFLQYITSDDFSVTRMLKLSHEKKHPKYPEYIPGRREILLKVRDYVLEAYNKHIISRSGTD